jgi:hypothetical protein
MVSQMRSSNLAAAGIPTAAQLSPSSGVSSIFDQIMPLPKLHWLGSFLHLALPRASNHRTSPPTCVVQCASSALAWASQPTKSPPAPSELAVPCWKHRRVRVLSWAYSCDWRCRIIVQGCSKVYKDKYSKENVYYIPQIVFLELVHI